MLKIYWEHWEKIDFLYPSIFLNKVRTCAFAPYISYIFCIFPQTFSKGVSLGAILTTAPIGNSTNKIKKRKLPCMSQKIYFLSRKTEHYL